MSTVVEQIKTELQPHIKTIFECPEGQREEVTDQIVGPVLRKYEDQLSREEKKEVMQWVVIQVFNHALSEDSSMPNELKEVLDGVLKETLSEVGEELMVLAEQYNPVYIDPVKGTVLVLTSTDKTIQNSSWEYKSYGIPGYPQT